MSGPFRIVISFGLGTLCLYLLFSQLPVDLSVADPSSTVTQPTAAETRRSQSRFREIPAPNLEDAGPPIASETLEERETLKRSGPPPEVDEVSQLIEVAFYSDDTDDRAFAVSELALLVPTPEVVTACVQLLRDREEDVRAEAALTLEVIEDPAAIPALERSAREDPSLEVREAAESALEALRKKARSLSEPGF